LLVLLKNNPKIAELKVVATICLFLTVDEGGEQKNRRTDEQGTDEPVNQ
jgi:hypothetical protein